VNSGVTLIVLATLCADTGAKGASWRDVPRGGMLLFATPQLQGSLFEGSVVILVEHDESGSLGLIINKPTGVAVADALAIEGAKHLDRSVYLGGPVAVDGMAGLVRTDDPPEGATPVIADVFFITDRASFAAAFQAKRAAQNVQIYIGYSGWGPGQLQEEIDRGSWVMTRGSAAKIFHDDPTVLWEEVYRLLERVEARAGEDGQEAKYRPA
jgi:putative transcriptional regulator